MHIHGRFVNAPWLCLFPNWTNYTTWVFFWNCAAGYLPSCSRLPQSLPHPIHQSLDESNSLLELEKTCLLTLQKWWQICCCMCDMVCVLKHGRTIISWFSHPPYFWYHVWNTNLDQGFTTVLHQFHGQNLLHVLSRCVGLRQTQGLEFQFGIRVCPLLANFFDPTIIGSEVDEHTDLLSGWNFGFSQQRGKQTLWHVLPCQELCGFLDIAERPCAGLPVGHVQNLNDMGKLQTCWYATKL